MASTAGATRRKPSPLPPGGQILIDAGTIVAPIEVDAPRRGATR